jgi:hypothetical protein
VGILKGVSFCVLFAGFYSPTDTMTQAFLLCQPLQAPVEQLLELLHQEPSLRTQFDPTAIQAR